MKNESIPVANPRESYFSHRTEIDDAINKVLSSGWYILGKNVEEFERSFAEYLGALFCIGVANGTDALSLALKAVGVCLGDEVITVSFTAIATVAAIEKIGATPVFIDIDPKTWCMDATKIEEAVTDKTRAIVPVHIYGQPAAMHLIMDIANRNNLKVVEDCAQAAGAFIDQKYVGTFGHAAAFSFYPTKNLGAIGDGGAVVTDDSDVAETVGQLRQYGWDRDRVSQRIGWNSRLDELQAGILLAKLPGLLSDNIRRDEIAKRYISSIDGVQIIPQSKSYSGVLPANHLFVVKSKERFDLRRFLAQHGICTAIHYPLPIHLQPLYRNRISGGGEDDLPKTEEASCGILSLPMYPELTDSQVELVCLALKKWISMVVDLIK